MCYSVYACDISHINEEKRKKGNCMKFNKGFTLAEILITLSVIVVIAAMTMSTLIKNYQKKVTVEKLRSAYSIFQQAIKLSEAHNGEIINWDFPNLNKDEFKTFAETYLVPYVKGKKVTGYSGPWAMSKTQAYIFDSQKSPFYQLPNGMVFGFFSQGYGYLIWVDINGRKAPNMAGKDIFLFRFHPKTRALEIEGIHCSRNIITGVQEGHCIDGDFVMYYYGANCKLAENSRYAGGSCGALIVKDGWKISEDYPW